MTDVLREKIESRIKWIEGLAYDQPLYSGAQYSSACRTIAAWLKYDLSDGVCRCKRLNGVGYYFDDEINLKCQHGMNETPEMVKYARDQRMKYGV